MLLLADMDTQLSVRQTDLETKDQRPKTSRWYSLSSKLKKTDYSDGAISLNDGAKKRDLFVASFRSPSLRAFLILLSKKEKKRRCDRRLSVAKWNKAHQAVKLMKLKIESQLAPTISSQRRLFFFDWSLYFLNTVSWLSCSRKTLMRKKTLKSKNV